MKTLLTLLISATCLLPLDTLLSQTIKTIKPAGGGDFTTLAAWEDWADGQTNAAQWAECYGGGNLGSVLLCGWASSPNTNSYPKIYAANGEQHNGISGGAYVNPNGSWTGIEDYLGFLRLVGLRVEGTAGYWASVAFVSYGERVLITDGYCGLYLFGSGTFRNCIILDCDYGIDVQAGTATFENCTIHNCASIGVFGYWGTHIYATNCAATSNAEDFVGYLGATLTLNNCLSSDGTADDYSGTNNLVNKSASNQFTDPDDGNLTLKAGADCINAGTIIAAFSEDIIGTSRPQGLSWDIGAFEYVEAAASSPPSVAITAPSDLYSTNAASLSVTTSYSNTNGVVGTVVLQRDGSPVDSYENPSGTTNDTHVFTLDISGLSDGTNSYTAIAFGGASQTGLSATSTVVRVVVDRTPPSITPSLQPAPNSFGWNNSAVTVSFQTTETLSGISSYPSTVYLSTETNDAEVVGIASDNAGNVATNYVYVSIDLTPPTLILDPGTGQTNDLSHPLLLIEYGDEGGASSASPSGLNLDTLQITLDSVDVTTSFYRFANAAFQMNTNLTAGTHSWQATISDYADNAVTLSNTFYATGAVNTNAPVISDLNLGNDEVLLMPDVGEIWVQGKISGAGSTVIASVNGGPAINMNRRDDDFGYLLPLDYGTNVIVLVGADASGQNLSSRAFKVVRTDRFFVEITSPEFGAFANGATQTVSGRVSLKMDEGLPEEGGIASVSVNGISATLNWGGASGGLVPWTVANVPPPGCTNSIMPLIVSLCWTNGSFSTNLCHDVPLGLLEGYEIVAKQSSELQFGSVWVDMGWYGGNPGEWSPTIALLTETSYEFTCPETSVTNSHLVQQIQTGGALTTNPSFEVIEWWGAATNEVHAVLPQPDRGLVFATIASNKDVNVYLATGETDLNIYGRAGDAIRMADGALTFRAPFHYGTNQAVIFTFEGVACAGAINLTNVLFVFGGETNTPTATTTNSASYLIELTGGEEYILDQSSFIWPGYATNYVTTNYIPYVGNVETTHSVCEDWFSFTGFHNADDVLLLIYVPETDDGTINWEWVIKQLNTFHVNLKVQKITTLPAGWQLGDITNFKEGGVYKWQGQEYKRMWGMEAKGLAGPDGVFPLGYGQNWSAIVYTTRVRNVWDQQELLGQLPQWALDQGKETSIRNWCSVCIMHEMYHAVGLHHGILTGANKDGELFLNEEGSFQWFKPAYKNKRKADFLKKLGIPK